MADEETVEPVAVLPIKRRKLCVTKWDSCLFCQKNDTTLKVGSSNGIEKVKEAFAMRRQANDDKHPQLLERLAPIIDHLESNSPKWHTTSCYASFCSKTNLSRLQKRSESSPAPTTDSERVQSVSCSHSAVTRHSVPGVNWAQCIFCQKRTNRCESLHQVLTTDCENRIRNIATNDESLNCKIAALDLIAYELKYHSTCLLKWSRDYLPESSEERLQSGNVFDKTFASLSKELDEGFEKGHIYTLSSLTDRYQLLLTLEGYKSNYPSQKLKERLTRHYETQIHFVRPLDQTKSLLVFPTVPVETVVVAMEKTNEDLKDAYIEREFVKSGIPDDEKMFLNAANLVAAKIRTDLKETPGHESYEGLDEEHARAVIPDSLYLLLQLVLTGADESEVDANNTQMTRVLSIAQDISFAASKGKKLTPKHIGLGLAVHQSTRSKSIVQLLSASGHTVSYEKVQMIDTSIAQHQINRFVANMYNFIPASLVPGRFLQFSGDNIDILEETIDGKGTFHGTQMAAFQRGPAATIDTSNTVLGKSRVLASIPEEFNKLQYSMYNKSTRPAAKFGSSPDSQQLLPQDPMSIDSKDLVWLTSRVHCANAEDQVVPGWTAFNHKISEVSSPVTTVGCIPAPATEYDTVWTVIQQCQAISNHLGQQNTVLTFDEGIYCKAKELAWTHADQCQCLVLRLGGFHSAMNFMKVIGQHYEGSGLSDVLIESGLYSESTVASILSGKQWNRAVRCHKLVFEALWRLYWQKFLLWLHETQDTYEDQLQDAAASTVTALQEKNNTELLSAVKDQIACVDSLRPYLERFDQEFATNPTFVFWKDYMIMVQILLHFIRAEREGLWDLHVTSFARMLPWMALYDHTNYLRWGSVYLVDMQQLERTAPVVFREFKQGNFVVKEGHGKFNQVSTDLALEHVNKTGKIAGGIIGITRTDSARDRWCLTYNDRTRLAEDTKNMFGLSNKAETEHKEAGDSRMKRDEKDVRHLVDQFTRFQVFEQKGPELICISTKDVAPQDVAHDLLHAEARGKDALTTFVQERLSSDASKSLYDRVPKIKPKTFGNMFNSNPALREKKQKNVKADRDLFRRLLVAAEGGRKIDLDQVLQFELTDFPCALSNADGTLHPTDKSALLHILEGPHAQQHLPNSAEDTKTCCIIDGMAMVQSIGRPVGCRTFGDLADVFTQCVHSKLSGTCTRVDVAFDHYEASSVKGVTRVKRAATHHRPIRRRIQNKDVPLPQQWHAFIDLPENKSDLVDFLSHQLIEQSRATLTDGKLVITAGGYEDPTCAVSSHGDISESLKSTHEEADTRIVLHAVDAANAGYNRLVVQCRDTDVLILLVHFCDRISANELWMSAGTKARPKYIPVHIIHNELPGDVCNNLPAFHAVTGCDSTSQFMGHAKKTAWRVFVRNPTLLANIGKGQLNENTLVDAERFVIHLYSLSSTETSINALRVSMFRHNNPETLPPTKDALQLHFKRAHLQASVWYAATSPSPDRLAPQDFGWKEGNAGKLEPQWTTQDPIPKSCPELQTCKCKSQCKSRNCTCVKHSVVCIGSCSCFGSRCYNPQNNVDEVNSDDDSD